MRRLGRLLSGGVVVGAGAVVATVALSGGPSSPLPIKGSVAHADELPAFTDCTQLRDWYRAAAVREMTAYGLPGSGYGIGFATDARGGPERFAGAAAAAPGAVAQKAVGNGATGTNNLVEGVDEPDLVKTDGTHVVGLSGNRLYVASVASGKLAMLGSLKLPGYGSELILDGDRALVVSNNGWYGPMLGDVGIGVKRAYPGDGRQTTTLALVDLSTPSKPVLLGSQEVDGTVLSSRLSDGTTRVVVSSTPALTVAPIDYPTLAMPQTRAWTQQEQRVYVAAMKAAERKALLRNREVARTALLSSLAPSTTIRDASGDVVRSGQLIPCRSVRHPAVDSGARTLSILTLRLQAADPFVAEQTAGVIAEGDLVAASAHRLYVATSRWGSWFMPRPTDQVTTSIHAFDTTAPGVTTYVASGTVAGYLLDRTAIDEQDGHLRIAITRGIPAPAPNEGVTPKASELSQSSVVVLDEVAGRLVVQGRVDGLGRGEQVRAVRWLGDVAAVVTFQQTDPLYLIDLSSPTAPRQRGSLHLTGYSAYLHPVGDGRLLGIGHEADANGRVQEAQVSLFDISDLDHPKRLDQQLLGNGWTQVESEPRAFTYLPDRQLALMPFTGYDGRGAAVSVKVGASSLDTAGRLAATAFGTKSDGAPLEYGFDQVSRLLPVGDQVVAVGNTSLRLVDPRTLRVADELTLPVQAWNR